MLDLFTDTNSTMLHDHIADTGQSWEQTDPATPLEIQANRVVARSTYMTILRAWSIMDEANIVVSVDATYDGSGGGVIARYNPVTEREVAFVVVPSADMLQLHYGEGVLEEVAVPLPLPSPATFNELMLEINGVNVRAWYRGVLVFDRQGILDLDLDYGVAAGVRFESSTDAAYQIDGFQVDPVFPQGGLFRLDPEYTTWFDLPVLNRVERQDIPIFDNDRFFVVNRIYPLMTSTTMVRFYVGCQRFPNDEVEWTGPYEFNPNTDQFFTLELETNLIAFRIESSDGGSFRLYGLKADVTPSRRFLAPV